MRVCWWVSRLAIVGLLFVAAVLTVAWVDRLLFGGQAYFERINLTEPLISLLLSCGILFFPADTFAGEASPKADAREVLAAGLGICITMAVVGTGHILGNGLFALFSRI